MTFIDTALQSDAGIISLVILCFIFGVTSLIYAVLYNLKDQELRQNAPWLYLDSSCTKHNKGDKHETR